MLDTEKNYTLSGYDNGGHCAVTAEHNLIPRQQLDNFTLLSSEIQWPPTGIVRKHYVKIEEITWDYSPDQWDYYHNKSLSESPAMLWTSQSTTTVGTRYRKSVYREYNDSSFDHAIDIPEWQGMMGPIFRGEVGDTFEIHVKNQASKNYSMHPHGVKYEFEMEGAIYQDALYNSIKPNHTFIYRWDIPPRSGPGPQDGDSLVWGYHSHVSETDLFDGLFGAIIIYRAGILDKSTKSKNVDNEIVTTALVIDENHSSLFGQTLQDWSAKLVMNDIQSSESKMKEFKLSNMKASINGIMFGGPKDFTMKVGQTIDWYLIAWGTDFDAFSISWTNAEVSKYNKSVQQVDLLPASFATVRVAPVESGKSSLGCNIHSSQGLVMEFNVL
ncbi:unnamed protein product [Umbelopsis vinacea]